MFTGLVQQMGTITAVEAGDTTRLTVTPDARWEPYIHGESIATSGVCLTVVAADADWFAVDVMAQTLALTSLADVAVGRRVNLERALRLGDRVPRGHRLRARRELRARRDPAERLLAGLMEAARHRRGDLARGGVEMLPHAKLKFVLIHSVMPFAASAAASVCVAREQCVFTLPSEHPIATAVSAISISSQ